MAPMGEFELLRRLRERLPPVPPHVIVGVGDDAAVVAGDGASVISVDLLVEDVHFRRATAAPRQIGHKALAAALSDLAAMGTPAGEAYIALTVPPDMSEDDCLEVLEGVMALADSAGATLAGGDVSAAAILTLGVTVVGRVAEPAAAVTRAGSAPGEIVAVTGTLGGAAAGLLLIEGRAGDLEGAEREELLARQLEPRPRLAAGVALAAAGATAMIDVSDGLAADAGHLASASGVRLEIDADSVPRTPSVNSVAAAAEVDPLELVLGGGEDYELLCTLPAGREPGARTALAGIGVPLARIGEVRNGSGVSVSSAGARRRTPSGFDQLSRMPRSSP